MKKSLLNSTAIVSTLMFGTTAFAAECVVTGNGSYSVGNNGALNASSCEISSVAPIIGNTSIWNTGFLVYSQGGKNNILKIENDIATTLKGSGGISVYGAGPTTRSTFDARGKTIDLTIQNLDSNASQNGGDRIAKAGAGVSLGGTIDIGTLNLKMLNLPNGYDGSFLGAGYEHYGVVAGSSVSSGEGVATNGLLSTAAFDNLNIQMSVGNYGGFRPQLINGIRVIQGANANSGNGSAGYVEVRNDLAIDINAANNDAIGIYVSGTEKGGVAPEAKIHNSNIKINSSAARANAIRLGKERSYAGTGEGKLTSTGHMDIDTLAAANSSAIAVVWQGATLDADADTASTTIKAGREAISISGNSSQATDQTVTSFNNLVATTASQTASLIDVGTGQRDYLLNVRGANSNLTAASNGWILDVKGAASSASKATFDFANGGLTGLVNKTAASTLNMAVRDNAVWNLQEKGGASASSTATFTHLDLLRKAQINAFGEFTLAGDINSAGGVLNLSDGVAGNTLTLKGDYVGSDNAAFVADTFLGGSGADSDRIVNDGGTISGLTLIRVNNTDASDAGAATDPGHGIKLVRSINGGTTTDDAFALDAGASNTYQFNGKTVVGAGAYAYGLYKGSNPTNTSATDEYGEDNLQNDWYLRSQLNKTDPVDPVDPEPQFTQGVPVYEAYPQVLLALNSLPTLQQRVGNRYWSNAGNIMIEQGADVIGTPAVPAAEAGSFTERNGIWGRIEGQHLKSKPDVTTSGTQYDADIFKMQAGLDGVLTETDNGLLIGGITVHYGHASADTRSEHGLGKISTDGYGFGGTLTWYGNNGFYVDTQAQATWYDSDLSTRGGSAVSLVNGNNGFGYALSAETGKRITLNDRWSVTPQAQLVYSNVDFDNFTDQYNGAVSLHKGDSLQGRIGISADYQNSWYNDKGMINRSYVYGIANLYYEFLDGSAVDVSSVRFASRNDRFWGGIGLGGSYNWDNDKYSIYGEGSVNTSLNNFGDSYAYKGTIGLRVKW